MDWLTAFILIRGAERIIIVLIGGASIWMGWRLFAALGGDASQSAEFGGASLTIKLQKVGPGVFFALFGSLLIAASFWNLPKASDVAEASAQIDATGGRREVSMAPSLPKRSAVSQSGASQGVAALDAAIAVAETTTAPSAELIDALHRHHTGLLAVRQSLAAQP